MNSNRQIDIFDMLKSVDGHTLLVNKLRQHLLEHPYASIDHMIRAVDEDRLFIPVFSTIYSVAPDGKPYRTKNWNIFILLSLGSFYNRAMSIWTENGTRTSMSYHLFQAIHDFGPGRDMYTHLERNAVGQHFHHDRFYRGNLTVVNDVAAPPLSAIERYSFDQALASAAPPLDPETVLLGHAMGTHKRKDYFHHKYIFKS